MENLDTAVELEASEELLVEEVTECIKATLQADQ